MLVCNGYSDGQIGYDDWIIGCILVFCVRIYNVHVITNEERMFIIDGLTEWKVSKETMLCV